MFKVAAIVSALAACASATLETVTLTHPYGSSAEVTLFGAQVVSFFPGMDPKRNVFFVSNESSMDGVNPINGGASVVFPNSGKVDGLPLDGFARVSTWTLASIVNAPDNDSPAVATFTLASNEKTHEVWPFDFALEYTVKLHPNTLEMGLNVQNTDTGPIDVQALLLNYLSVDSVLDEGVRVRDLKGVEYYDTIAGANKTETRDNIVITEQTDNVYRDAPDVVDIAIRTVDPPVVILDFAPGAQRPNLPAPTGDPVDRNVTITKYGTISGNSPRFIPTDFAVRNPWIEGAKAMEDFGDEEYKYMIAAGPGHVSGMVTLLAGETFTLYQNVTVNYPLLAIV